MGIKDTSELAKKNTHFNELVAALKASDSQKMAVFNIIEPGELIGLNELLCSTTKFVIKEDIQTYTMERMGGIYVVVLYSDLEDKSVKAKEPKLTPRELLEQQDAERKELEDSEPDEEEE